MSHPVCHDKQVIVLFNSYMHRLSYIKFVNHFYNVNNNFKILNLYMPYFLS